MIENGDVSFLRERVRERLRHLACAFLDSLFLASWAVSNVLFGHFVERLNLTGSDHVVLICFHIIFGIYTVAPVCVWIYKDLGIMIVQANSDIAAAREAGVALSIRSTCNSTAVDTEAPQ